MSSTPAPKHIAKTEYKSPLGLINIFATEKGICLLEFTEQPLLGKESLSIKKQFDPNLNHAGNAHLIQVIEELKEYFSGERKSFNVSLDLHGTDFQKTVWESLLLIDYGTTSTYQQQAQSINLPKAIRAIASANGKNLISIIIPCHRVIGKDRNMTGYSGGIERKKWLITHEQKGMQQLSIGF